MNQLCSKMVSIIIPFYNSEKTLHQCLSSLFNINYNHKLIEIIAVDNGSTDNSVNIASKFNVNLIYKPEGSISSVRNFGAANSKGEILAFVDSDCLVTRDWLINAMTILQDSSVGVTGSGYSTPEKYTWVEKAWLLEMSGESFETNFLPGGNLIVKTDVFKSIHGFDEKLSTCEDADFCLRAKKNGKRVVNFPEVKTIHLGNSKSVSQFIKKEYWYGTGSLDSLRNDPLNKTTWITIIFAIFGMLLVIGMFIYFTKQYSGLIWASILSIASIALLSTANRVVKSRKYLYTIHIFTLFLFYYTARACAMIVAIKGKFHD